ncbi:MAG: hypothetical protein IPP33_14935 [Flavobacteriales bacterium]|nr:hypothetical protein [Flavobacteriales bacterium]
MKYVPIECALHDQYLAWATNRTPVAVTFMDEQGTLRIVSGTIADVYTSKEGSAEWMIVSGVTVRLDHIHDVRHL